MPIFRLNKNMCLLLLLCVFCATVGFAQAPANCPALKQRYSEAIQNRHSAAITNAPFRSAYPFDQARMAWATRIQPQALTRGPGHSER